MDFTDITYAELIKMRRVIDAEIRKRMPEQTMEQKLGFDDEAIIIDGDPSYIGRKGKIIKTKITRCTIQLGDEIIDIPLKNVKRIDT